MVAAEQRAGGEEPVLFMDVGVGEVNQCGEQEERRLGWQLAALVPRLAEAEQADVGVVGRFAVAAQRQSLPHAFQMLVGVGPGERGEIGGFGVEAFVRPQRAQPRAEVAQPVAQQPGDLRQRQAGEGAEQILKVRSPDEHGRLLRREFHQALMQPRGDGGVQGLGVGLEDFDNRFAQARPGPSRHASVSEHQLLNRRAGGSGQLIEPFVDGFVHGFEGRSAK